MSCHRTDWVVTNDLSQITKKAAQEASGFRWKIEQLCRESKQLTGLECCQCRTARIQRQHIYLCIPGLGPAQGTGPISWA